MAFSFGVYVKLVEKITLATKFPQRATETDAFCVRACIRYGWIATKPSFKRRKSCTPNGAERVLFSFVGKNARRIPFVRFDDVNHIDHLYSSHTSLWRLHFSDFSLPRSIHAQVHRLLLYAVLFLYRFFLRVWTDARRLANGFLSNNTITYIPPLSLEGRSRRNGESYRN